MGWYTVHSVHCRADEGQWEQVGREGQVMGKGLLAGSEMTGRLIHGRENRADKRTND